MTTDSTDLFRFSLQAFRACELVKANLSSTQKSMKEKYDVHAVERDFKPGQKVLALLPVPSNKPYVEKSIHLVKELTNVNVVVSEPKELNSELRSSHLSPTNTTKLTNSNVLRNLDSKLSHLEESRRQDLKRLLQEYKELFPDVPSRTDQIYHDVDVGDAAPVKQHPYRLNSSKQRYLKKRDKIFVRERRFWTKQQLLGSPCILVPKPDGSYCMCADCRKVNNVTKTDTSPIVRMDDCINKAGKAKYVTEFDLLNGFWQVPLTDRAKEISAFATPDGLFKYKVMLFGMRNSPATFQRHINKVTTDRENCKAYIDDVIIFIDIWEKHFKTTSEFFKRLSGAKLTIDLSKSEFGQAKVTYLGHVVGQGQVKPVSAEVEAMANFPRPENKKQLMRFLIMAGNYKRFCFNFASVT